MREDQGPVEQAHEEIEAFRADYAAELEVEAITAMDAGRFDQAERALIGLVALGGVDAQVNRDAGSKRRRCTAGSNRGR